MNVASRVLTFGFLVTLVACHSPANPQEVTPALQKLVAGQPLQAGGLFAPLRANKRYGAHRLLIVQAHWALAAADPVLAQEAIDEARSVIAATAQADDPAWHKIHQIQARVHLAKGRAADALKAANDALEWSQRLAIDPEGSVQVAEDGLLRAQAERMLGHTEAARADAALAERHAPVVRLAHTESLL